ncbi:MAG: serine hydrolase domain-containing protein [Myxococcota bacterium]
MRSLLFIPLVWACASGRPASGLEAQIDQLFAGYNRDTPGVAVTVTRGGETLLAKGYGTANLEHRIPIGHDTVFHAASVSKQFTAFAVYLLVSDGAWTM